MRGNLLLEESKSPQEKDRRRRRKEGELIGFMDEHGICTDASMATHIENVGARDAEVAEVKPAPHVSTHRKRYCLTNDRNQKKPLAGSAAICAPMAFLSLPGWR
eukprot:GEMP01081504.1.p1 GENE.GEMP01081504.1~~GEMP01081504.1.p1  ORF type:complete len:104 (+),score=22.36 GEMP01081504.1:94-405(+)